MQKNVDMLFKNHETFLASLLVSMTLLFSKLAHLQALRCSKIQLGFVF
jgi:hypothetical protein